MALATRAPLYKLPNIPHNEPKHDVYYSKELRDKRIQQLCKEKHTQYALDVYSGKQVAGCYIRYACENFLNDLGRVTKEGTPVFNFDNDEIVRARKLLALMKHYKGKASGESFTLFPWLDWVISSILCYKWNVGDKKGYRRYTSAFLEVSRKQGKSATLSALSMILLFQERGSEILMGANSREQAHILYDASSEFARQLNPQGDILKVFKNEIKMGVSRIKVIHADSSKLDGYSPSVYCLDEVEEMRTTKLKDVLESGMGYREQPLGLQILTAGFDKSLPAYEMRQTNIDILMHQLHNDNIFSAIYELDPDDDYLDESVWVKAAPNIGVTTPFSWYREQAAKAKISTTDRLNFQVKNLNMWQDSLSEYLPQKYVQACTPRPQDYNIEECYGADWEIFGGWDLSSVEDMSSVAWCFHNMITDEIRFAVKYYLPQETVERHRNSAFYQRMHAEGWLVVTPGNVIDYDIIAADIIDMQNKCYNGITTIYYDPYNATQIAVNLQNEGIMVEGMSQSCGNYNKCTKEFIRRVMQVSVTLPPNPLFKWNISCSVLKTDQNGNQKPIKANESNKFQGKIDGLIAVLSAFNAYLANSNAGFSISA